MTKLIRKKPGFGLLLVLGIVLIASLAWQVGPSSASKGEDGQIIPGRFIVLVADGVDAAEVAASHGIAVRHIFRAAVNGFAATVANVDALRSDERVVLVEAERMYRFAPQDDPTGINRIEVDKNPTIGGGVVVNQHVAIIDSGIDGDHPDLNVAGGINFANGQATKWDDGNGHGTHVAGIVGAIDNGIGVVGVAPGASVWAVRVCGNSGFCFTGDMVAGIDWVAAQKASGAINFASANMSISHSDEGSFCSASSGAIHQAICGLVNEGVVFAIAAGNDARLKTDYPEVLSVSALADFDGKAGGFGSATCRSDEDDTLANFSNYGPTVDIAAPGVCILSTWKGGGYNIISGTSMASPHVAGAVALYLHASGVPPAQSADGVDAIEAAIVNAALPQGHACGYINEHSGQGSDEPVLFVNAAVFGGDGSCDSGPAGPTATPTAIASEPTATAPEPTATTVPSGDVSVESISYSTSGGRFSDRHLNILVGLVNDVSDPVSGASVSIDLFRDGVLVASEGGITDVDGTVIFSLNNAASGCYTTTVTDVNSAGLSWDGISPVTAEFCK